jgi:uncharacterized protein (UPF0216 family)
VSGGYEKLMKAIEFERTRSRMTVPLAKKLTTLLSEERPCLVSRDGMKLLVEREDLDKVTMILGMDRLEGVSMPIYFRPAPSLGHNFYELLGVERGSEMEGSLKAIVFGLVGEDPRDYLYGYEVQRLRRKIPSLVYVFY